MLRSEACLGYEFTADKADILARDMALLAITFQFQRRMWACFYDRLASPECSSASRFIDCHRDGLRLFISLSQSDIQKKVLFEMVRSEHHPGGKPCEAQ